MKRKDRTLIIILFIILFAIFYTSIVNGQKIDNPLTINKYLKIPKNQTLFGQPVPITTTSKDRFAGAMAFHIDHIARTIVVLERLSELDAYLTKLLKEKGLHSDFKYLFAWESGLDPRANSGSAVGFAQFRRSTAFRYGLLSTSWGDSNGIWDVDERMCPKAFYASAEYIRDLLDRFTDPLLAVAAYNTGENRISRKMNEQQTDEYWNIWMYKETEDFVYHILSLKILYEKTKNTLFKPRWPISFIEKQIRLRNDTTLRDYFNKNNISFDLNGRWNRHFREGVIPKRRKVTIYIQKAFTNGE